MITFRKPDVETIRKFLNGRGSQDLTYSSIGSTASNPPEGYILDHTRVKLGEGKHTFAAGKSALQQWHQFRVRWTEILPPTPPIQEGELVAVVARVLGIWWTNPARIVYVVEESKSTRQKFGFAYGTLPGHVGSGEERFLVEMDESAAVWYDILAFSRPGNLLARIGYPYMRWVQKQFGKQSATAMRQAISETLNTAPQS